MTSTFLSVFVSSSSSFPLTGGLAPFLTAGSSSSSLAALPFSACLAFELVFLPLLAAAAWAVAEISTSSPEALKFV
jgi:hypothetical protein